MKRFHPTRIPLFRWLLTRVVSWIRPETLRTKAGFDLWVPRSDKSIYLVDLFLTGYYEKTETNHVIKLLTNGDAVVDVGANVGYYTCMMSKCVGENGVVYAFEPVPDNRDVLNKNIASNRAENVEVSDCALGDSTKHDTISLSDDNCGAHSLVPPSDAQRKLGIEVTRFDQVVPMRDIALVKIDVEGYELSVLEGMSKHLENKLIKNILVEVTPRKIKANSQHPERFFSLIASHGFAGKVLSSTVDDKSITVDDIRKNLPDFTNDKFASFNLLLSLGRH